MKANKVIESVVKDPQQPPEQRVTVRVRTFIPKRKIAIQQPMRLHG